MGAVRLRLNDSHVAGRVLSKGFEIEQFVGFAFDLHHQVSAASSNTYFEEGVRVICGVMARSDDHSHKVVVRVKVVRGVAPGK